MAEQVQWLDGQAKVPGNVEKICPKRHIRQNQWQSEWNNMYLNHRSAWCYDYISDYECIFDHPVGPFFGEYFYPRLWDNLQAAKRQGTNIPITNLAHFTEREFAERIIKSGGFRGGIKKINEDPKGHDVKAKFSWWSPIFGQNDIKLVRDTLGAAIQPFLAERYDQCNDQDDAEKVGDQDDGEVGDNEEDSDQNDEEGSDQYHGDGSDQDDEKDSDQVDEEDGDEYDAEDGDQDEDQDDNQHDLTQLHKQFATSNAFSPNAQRPNRRFYFQYNINDLCDCYGTHFDGEVQFKILGTFGYKKEVMHAVLVCSQENGDGLFAGYPPVLTPDGDVDNEAVVTQDNNGNWVWKPQATGTVINRLPNQSIFPKYRRWELVSFAFHIPDEWAENEQLMFVPELGDNLHQI